MENHLTAAWVNIDKLEDEERVFRPSYPGVEEAKEYVDENRK